jgi:LacI family transcriptional regulator, repressor for deo operon, udp, cdd, tsx, nupC, and nupG
MIGIEDVARAVGVSAATVSRALSGRGPVSETTRQQVLDAARELGYVVSSNASGLASGRTRAVGVIVPFLNRWFYAQVLEAAQNALVAAGYDLTLYNLGGGADTRRSVFEQFLFRQRVDGLIAISLEVRADEVQRLHEIGKPIVCVGGPIPGLRTVNIDDIGMSRRATEHLTELGHRRIAHIGGGGGEYDFHLPLNRRVGYELALRAAGIEPDPALVEPGDFSIMSGHQVASRLLALPDRPTAIFAASDAMAIGAMLAARDAGLRVPEDLSVVGIDDHELAPFFGLTTIAQYPAVQGAKAVELLLREFSPAPEATENGEGNEPLDFDLVVRTTTAPPPPGV